MKPLNAATKTSNLITIAVAATLAFAAAVTGAKPAAARKNDILGLLFGGAIGGIVGSNIGSGRGKLVATAAGTLIGAGIGSSSANGGTRNFWSTPPSTIYVPQATTPTMAMCRARLRHIVTTRATAMAAITLKYIT